MVEHLPIERASAEAEVRRYCAARPTSSAMRVGRELLRPARCLRERAGRRSDPKAFHDELLAYGGLPRAALARWGMELGEE